jgi:hypothetical protein
MKISRMKHRYTAFIPKYETFLPNNPTLERFNEQLSGIGPTGPRC